MFLEGYFKIKISQVQYLHWNLTQQYTSFLLYMYYALLEIYVEIKNTLEIFQERLSLVRLSMNTSLFVDLQYY